MVPHNLYIPGPSRQKSDNSFIVLFHVVFCIELIYSIFRRSVWKNKWEMTYVGPSQVLVKPLAGSGPFASRGVILRSQYGFEIHDVRIMGGLSDVKCMYK